LLDYANVRAVALFLVSLAVACTIHTSREPVGVTEVTSAPANLEAYPSTEYEGRTVYLVDDRWVYFDGTRWVRYASEPPELESRRATLQRRRPYVQQAPPATRTR
jgi:hypothetical protein